MSPLGKPDGCITHSPLEKATEKLEIPLSCFPNPKVNSFAFWSSKAKKLLLDLNSFGAVDPNGIFPLFFFIKTAGFMAPKIYRYVVLRKLARMGSFASCWRCGNVTPLSKSGSRSLIPSEYRPISVTPVLPKIFEHLLAKHLNAYAETN